MDSKLSLAIVASALSLGLLLQGCGELSLDGLIHEYCKAMSGEHLENLKKELSEKAAEQCKKMVPEGTQIGGSDCEKNALINTTNQSEEFFDNETQKCADELSDKLKNATSNPMEWKNLIENMTKEFGEKQKNMLEDYKNNLLDNVTSTIDKYKPEDDAKAERLFELREGPTLANFQAHAPLLVGCACAVSVVVASGAVLIARRRGLRSSGEQEEGMLQREPEQA